MLGYAMRVEYHCQRKAAVKACWAFVPLMQGLPNAMALARDGLGGARDVFGARGFQILNEAGTVIAEEWAEA